MRLHQHGVATRLCVPTPVAHCCTIPPSVGLTPLAPSHRVPIGGTGALRHQDASTRLAQPLAGHGATTGPPDHDHRPPTRHRDPSPGPLAPLAPARLVEVGHGWRMHVQAGFLSWRRDRCWRRRLPLADRPHTQRHATPLVHRLLGRTCGETVRPRTQRHRRLDARPVRPTGNPGGPGRPCHRTACGTHQLVPLLCGHNRRDGRHLDDLVSPQHGISSPSGGGAVPTLLGFDSHHFLPFCHRAQGTRMTRVPWLTPATAFPGRTTWRDVWWWSARRGT